MDLSFTRKFLVYPSEVCYFFPHGEHDCGQIKTRETPGDSVFRRSACADDGQTWIEKENAACNFRDERRTKCFRLLLKQFWTNIGQSTPFACQDWAGTKAAYRLFANADVSEQVILGGHFQATARATSTSCSARHKTLHAFPRPYLRRPSGWRR